MVGRSPVGAEDEERQWERKGRERGERGHPGEEKEIETRGS